MERHEGAEERVIPPGCRISGSLPGSSCKPSDFSGRGTLYEHETEAYVEYKVIIYIKILQDKIARVDYVLLQLCTQINYFSLLFISCHIIFIFMDIPVNNFWTNSDEVVVI